MSWGNLFLLGDIGQQIDMQEIETDIARLRARLHDQRIADRTHEEALATLRSEVTDLRLVVAELARLLVAGGALPAEAVERVVRGVDDGSAGEQP